MLAPLVVALLAALGGGRLYLRFAPARALDIPNQRSSHSRPTPRGGGIVIVGGFLLGLAVWLLLGGSLSPRALGWLAGAVLVAGVGFVDDLRSLPAVPRLVVQLLGAFLLTIAGVQERELPLVAVLVLGFIYVVGVTNIYNFMDGIDGLAATQAIVAGTALAAAGLIVQNPLVATGGSLLAAATAGFLVYNLPPARLFMGDVGSTFLGFNFAGLCLLGSIGVGGGQLPVEFGAIVLAPFLFDGLVTLARRVLRGERWYAAHRSHFYQRLVRVGLSHGQVTGLYAGLAIVAAGFALVGLGAGQSQRETLALLAYLPMLVVVGLTARLESGGPRRKPPQQPKDSPTIVPQGPS
jgi:UDP-N-acetylmuramyl pentapeptide phosphotransferase/UDP-N-acetylglucosamine-1-phosphate transferase